MSSKCHLRILDPMRRFDMTQNTNFTKFLACIFLLNRSQWINCSGSTFVHRTSINSSKSGFILINSVGIDERKADSRRSGVTNLNSWHDVHAAPAAMHRRRRRRGARDAESRKVIPEIKWHAEVPPSARASSRASARASYTKTAAPRRGLSVTWSEAPVIVERHLSDRCSHFVMQLASAFRKIPIPWPEKFNYPHYWTNGA